MEFQIIKDLRRNAEIVWSPEEKMLYSRHGKRYGKIEYICYNKVLHNNYIVKKNAKKMKKKEKKEKKNKKKNKNFYTNNKNKKKRKEKK